MAVYNFTGRTRSKTIRVKVKWSTFVRGTPIVGASRAPPTLTSRHRVSVLSSPPTSDHHAAGFAGFSVRLFLSEIAVGTSGVTKRETQCRLPTMTSAFANRSETLIQRRCLQNSISSPCRHRRRYRAAQLLGRARRNALRSYLPRNKRRVTLDFTGRKKRSDRLRFAQ